MNDVFDPVQLALATRKLSPDKLAHSLDVGRLAARQGPAYATVGLLHDMIEDSDVTLDELRDAGVTEAELHAIRLLTRGPETYEEYIALVDASGDRLAISIKICDLLDHLHPAINAGLTDLKAERYLWALPMLVATLRRLNANGDSA